MSHQVSHAKQKVTIWRAVPAQAECYGLFPSSLFDGAGFPDGCGALELEVQLEGFLVHEQLPAMRALHLPLQLDAHVRERSIARLGLWADLHGAIASPTSSFGDQR